MRFEPTTIPRSASPKRLPPMRRGRNRDGARRRPQVRRQRIRRYLPLGTPQRGFRHLLPNLDSLDLWLGSSSTGWLAGLNLKMVIGPWSECLLGWTSGYSPKGFFVFFLGAASLRWPHWPDLCVAVGRSCPLFYFLLKAGKTPAAHTRILLGQGCCLLSCQGLKSEDGHRPCRNPFTSYKPEKTEQH